MSESTPAIEVLDLTKRYGSAAERFRFIVDRYPDGDLADDALFFLGEAHWKQDQSEEAARAWSRLVEEYPESKYQADAEKHLRRMAQKD